MQELDTHFTERPRGSDASQAKQTAEQNGAEASGPGRAWRGWTDHNNEAKREATGVELC